MKKIYAMVLLFFFGQCFAGEIHDMIKNGRAAEAVLYLKAHPEVREMKDDSECSPLHLASRFGTPALVDYLIKAGADLNSRSYNEFTPLHVCRSPISAELLIRAGARADLVDVWGDTALQMLAQDHQAVICAALLKAGVTLDIVSALYLGRRDEAMEIAKRDPSSLKEHVGTLRLFGNATPLGLAVANNDFELVKLFVSLGAPVNGPTDMPQAGGPATPICTAIGRGYLDMTAYLLEHGAIVEGAAGKFYPSIVDYAVDHADRPMKDLLFRYCHDPRLGETNSQKSNQSPGPEPRAAR